MEDEWREEIRLCEGQVSSLNSTITSIASRLRCIDQAWGVSSTENQADLILLSRCLQDGVKLTRNAGSTDLQLVEEASSLLGSNLEFLDMSKQQVASLSDEATDCFDTCARLSRRLSSLSDETRNEDQQNDKRIKDAEDQLKAVQDHFQSIGTQISQARTDKIADEKELSRWRTAHSITKWIPSVNILTYPITKIGTKVYEGKLQGVENTLLILQQDQTNRHNEIKNIRSMLASGTELLQTVGTLRGRAQEMELQCKEI